jgi:hypothetical protein
VKFSLKFRLIFRLKFSYNQYSSSSGSAEHQQVTLLSVYNTQVEPSEIQAEIQGSATTNTHHPKAQQSITK